MNYTKILEEKVKRGFEEFINFIRDDKNLLYNVYEVNNETEVQVEIFDENEETDIVGTYYFDELGNFIRSI